jgi:hypothetical protein
MRYISLRGRSSEDEFRAMLADREIETAYRREVLTSLSDIEARRRTPATFGVRHPSSPDFYVWTSGYFRTPSGRRAIWLAYEPDGPRTTLLHVLATFTGGPREREMALMTAKDRQINGERR